MHLATFWREHHLEKISITPKNEEKWFTSKYPFLHGAPPKNPKPGFGLPDSSLVVRRIKKSSLFPPKLEIFVVGFRVRWVKVEHKFPCKWSQNWIDGIAYWNICSLLKIEFSKESESHCPHVIVFGACHDNEATSSQPLSRDSF